MVVVLSAPLGPRNPNTSPIARPGPARRSFVAPWSLVSPSLRIASPSPLPLRRSPPTCCSSAGGSGRPRWLSRPTCSCCTCWYPRRPYPAPWSPTWPSTAPHRPRQLTVPGGARRPTGPGRRPRSSAGAVPAGLPARPGRPHRHQRRRPACGHHGRGLAGPSHRVPRARPSGDALGLDPTCREPGRRSSSARATTASICASGLATTIWSWPPTARCRFGCPAAGSNREPARRELATSQAGMKEEPR
jgi:hypothetical protein